MTGYPTAAELAEAVEGFLREEVMPALEGRLHFRTIVDAVGALVDTPSAWVSARKNGWSNGAGLDTLDGL